MTIIKFITKTRTNCSTKFARVLITRSSICTGNWISPTSGTSSSTIFYKCWNTRKRKRKKKKKKEREKRKRKKRKLYKEKKEKEKRERKKKNKKEKEKTPILYL